MCKARNCLCHLTIILSLLFVAFLILDEFNPMMNFVDNRVSRWLLMVLSISGIAQSILTWKIRFRRVGKASCTDQ